MSNNKIKIYIPPKKVYPNSKLQLKVGLIFNSSLTDVTEDTEFQILIGTNRIIPLAEKGLFECLSVGDVYIKAIYSAGGLGNYTDAVSFVITPYTFFPNQIDIFDNLKQSLPSKVYDANNSNTVIYADMTATAKVFSKLNQQMGLIVKNFFINTTANRKQIAEEIFPNQYITNPTNELLQFMVNLDYVITSAPYDIAKALSQYIYLRKAIKLFVYIPEYIVDVDKTWTMGEVGKSELNYTTYLGIDPIIKTLNIVVYDPLTEIDYEFYLELSKFANRICPASCAPLIIVKNIDVESDGLIIIGMTYKNDTRLVHSYCVKFDPEALEQTIGAKLYDYNIDELLDFEVLSPIENQTINTGMRIVVLGRFPNNITKDITFIVSKTATINQTEDVNNYIYLCCDNITIKSSCPIGTFNLSITYKINNIEKIFYYQLTKEA